MLAKTLRRELAKINAIITVPAYTPPGLYVQYTARIEGGTDCLTWYEERDGRVTCLCTPSDQTDMRSDCFCDTFHSTIRSAINSLIYSVREEAR